MQTTLFEKTESSKFALSAALLELQAFKEHPLYKAREALYRYDLELSDITNLMSAASATLASLAGLPQFLSYSTISQTFMQTPMKLSESSIILPAPADCLDSYKENTQSAIERLHVCPQNLLSLIDCLKKPEVNLNPKKVTELEQIKKDLASPEYATWLNDISNILKTVNSDSLKKAARDESALSEIGLLCTMVLPGIMDKANALADTLHSLPDIAQLVKESIDLIKSISNRELIYQDSITLAEWQKYLEKAGMICPKIEQVRILASKLPMPEQKLALTQGFNPLSDSTLFERRTRCGKYKFSPLSHAPLEQNIFEYKIEGDVLHYRVVATCSVVLASGKDQPLINNRLYLTFEGHEAKYISCFQGKTHSGVFSQRIFDQSTIRLKDLLKDPTSLNKFLDCLIEFTAKNGHSLGHKGAEVRGKIAKADFLKASNCYEHHWNTFADNIPSIGYDVLNLTDARGDTSRSEKIWMGSASSLGQTEMLTSASYGFTN